MATKGARGSMLTAKNTNPIFSAQIVDIWPRYDSFKSLEFNLLWTDYLLCGYFAARDLATISGMSYDELDYNVYMLVDGNIPSGCGISSSSALVVATALSVLQIFGLQIELTAVADSCIRAERLIGTMGGGMDQTVSCLAIAGKAILIQSGLPVEYVELPGDIAVVLADSLVKSKKAAGTRLLFNTRVVECRLGAIVLSSFFSKTSPIELKDIHTIKDVEVVFKNHCSDSEESNILSLLLEFVKSSLHEGLYTISEIENIISTNLGTTFSLSSIFHKDSAATQEVLVSVERFHLRHRCLHVIHEAIRVKSFVEVCRSSSPDVEILGRILNDGHSSLRDDYECSCDEVDMLQQIAIESGALGSRMTGAGWGGMVVNLVRLVDVDLFIQRMTAFFETISLPTDETDIGPDYISEKNFSNILFVSSSAAGATYYSI